MTPRVHLILLSIALCLALLMGCNEKPPTGPDGGRYDKGYQPPVSDRPQPVISGMTPPAGQSLANVSMVTITGQNFDPNPANNYVFFDKTQVPVISATATQLVVKAPSIMPKDSLNYSFNVKIGVYKALMYSAFFRYTLSAAAPEFGAFSPTDVPGAVTTDAAGNAYVALNAAAKNIGIFKITRTGDRTLYSPPFSETIAKYSGMKFAADSSLYCVLAGRNIIWRIPPASGPVPPTGISAAIWLSSATTSVGDIDIDAQGNIWGVGGGGKIVRVTPSKVVKTFIFAGVMRAVRIHAGYLYVGGTRSSADKVWRLPIISADSLGTEEEYFNYTSYNAAGQVNALAFSADGDLYVGTNGADGITIVHPSKSAEPLYPGVIKPSTVSLAWGQGYDLWQSRVIEGTSTPALVMINTLKNGATN